jgi:hypothetical protein
VADTATKCLQSLLDLDLKVVPGQGEELNFTPS